VLVGSVCKNLIDLGGFFQKELDTRLNLLDSGKLKGLGVKPPLHLLPQIEQRGGRGLPPAALVAMGVGTPGGLGFVQGEELEEEVEGNSVEGLPAAETQRSDRQSWSTPAVGELQQVRRQHCPCRAAQQGGG
jgi:hypothetical protein